MIFFTNIILCLLYDPKDNVKEFIEENFKEAIQETP